VAEKTLHGWFTSHWAAILFICESTASDEISSGAFKHLSQHLLIIQDDVMPSTRPRLALSTCNDRHQKKPGAYSKSRNASGDSGNSLIIRSTWDKKSKIGGFNPFE